MSMLEGRETIKRIREVKSKVTLYGPPIHAVN